MLTPSLQGLVDGLADRLGLPVVLEDADQQLLAYSPHYEITDRVREQTILRRTTGQGIVDTFGAFRLPSRSEPFVIEARPDLAMMARLCIPVRYLDASLGYAWILLPDGSINDDALRVVLEAQEQLSSALLSDSRVRALENDTVLSLMSSDAHTRVRGLTDVEARGGFETPRRLTVAVCAGPAWADVSVRGSFWSAAWGPDPRTQLRGTTEAEGIALISLREDPGVEFTQTLDRALTHMRRRRDTAPLVVGVGSAVSSPDEAHESYRQARLAARVGLRATELGSVVWWDRLGVYRFLSQLPLRTLSEAVDPRMISLVAQDPIYAHTLETYLRRGGAINKVSETLHIHRTTLYYRLDRVRAAGLEPTSGADHATILSSFAALRLLGRWPPREIR